MRVRLRLLIVVLALLAPSSVEAQSTFYEAYERGMDLGETGRLQEAREAFKTAAAIRPDPGERVKTYGLNFLHDYDPYFHLAKLEIELGLLEDAQANLDRSAEAGVSSTGETERLRSALFEALRDRRSAEAIPTPAHTVDLATPTPQPSSTPRPSPTPQLTATPAPTILRVQSDPSGAEVFVDGLLLGITPVGIPVEPGERHVEVRLDGHEFDARDHVVDRGRVNDLVFRLQQSPEPTQVPESTAVREPVETEQSIVVSTNPSPPALEKRPVEMEERTAEDPQTTVTAVLLPVLLAVLLALGLFMWSKRNRPRSRRSRRSPTTPGALTESTIGLTGLSPLPDDIRQEFGDYTLNTVLGRGGMGTTYHAQRRRDGAPVALKVLHEHLLDQPRLVKRFLREGALGATVHHPNIVRIFEVGRVERRLFIAMEFVQGQTLAERLEEAEFFALRPALEVTREIALALDYAHVKGIIHRDLKPANVMLLPDDSVKVIDFGIARIIDAPGLTGTNKFIGTPLFGAPEAVTGDQVDHRADLYSLGIILYTMLSGHPPFRADSPLRLLEMHRDDSLPPFKSAFEIPARVQDLVKRLTAKSKDDRFPSAEVLLVELNAILNEI